MNGHDNTATEVYVSTAEQRFKKFLFEVLDQVNPDQHAWMSLVDVRPHLYGRGISREAQDRYLKALSAREAIHLAGDSNTKALRDEDHEAALTFGGGPNHLIQRGNRT